MSPTTVLPIQRVMASAAPGAWRDGIVLETGVTDTVVAFLDGDVQRLRVAGADGVLSVGDPVAHHPVAEILSAGGRQTTARSA
ncbi:hypothetical protein BIU97_13950 [Curtobacterium sp. MCBA15_009]|uniref:hypothetical protein n=1 Tax=Curtobacterium sp. MCBA15_009 TaxID=1898737 RepID=UPI0008DD6F1A|nr:hypothetical protein [Curtobacterium sp. MCBA15_009]OII15769.1 hypothetical protein BIU97_13950 [Curtobacterium sp. MCBA15_009]